MSPLNHSFERCRSFIDSNFVPEQRQIASTQPILAISRQAFSGSHDIAEELIRLLEHDSKLGGKEWALFDNSLVERVLDDHHLPQTIARYMPEDRDRDFTGLINEILGVHPSSWKLFHYTCDTIHKLSKVGNVILIGRGAHIITRNMPTAFRVRIVAPMETRIKRAVRRLDISNAQATSRIRQDDSSRAAFIRSHFDESINDPLAYDMTINTGSMSADEVADILYRALQRR